MFTFPSKTKLYFGKGQTKKISSEIHSHENVLLLYGGGSIKTNGAYSQVINALTECTVFEFNGVSANPEYENLLDAVKVAKEKKIDWIIAIGGGSVIDAAKFVAAAACLPSDTDLWNYLFVEKSNINDALPIGCVLTLPATGSESNEATVISKRITQDKISFKSPFICPKFTVLDPEFTLTLPKRQVANGIVDAFIHTTEQYLTSGYSYPLQDKWAEGLLSTLIEYGPISLNEPSNLKAREAIMWCANQALYGLIGAGQKQDWVTHAIAHELTALYGLDHARSLGPIWASVMFYRFNSKKDKLARFGRSVWNIDGDDDFVALEAIKKTNSFFMSLELQIDLNALNICPAEAAALVENQLIRHGRFNLGEDNNIQPKDCYEIIKLHTRKYLE